MQHLNVVWRRTSVWNCEEIGKLYILTELIHELAFKMNEFFNLFSQERNGITEDNSYLLV